MVYALGFGIHGYGFRASDLGFWGWVSDSEFRLRIKNLGFMIKDSGLVVMGLGCRVRSSGFRVWSFGFRVQVSVNRIYD